MASLVAVHVERRSGQFWYLYQSLPHGVLVHQARRERDAEVVLSEGKRYFQSLDVET